MNEQEAQQAEISEIRELNNLSIELGGDTPAIWRCHVLLKIVDSQAQKIAEQGKRVAELEKDAAVYIRIIERLGIQP